MLKKTKQNHSKILFFLLEKQTQGDKVKSIMQTTQFSAKFVWQRHCIKREFIESSEIEQKNGK